VAGGPAGRELFSLPVALAETLILLTSSFTAGIGMLMARAGKRGQVLVWFGMTFLLGVSFLVLELREFGAFIHEGHTWHSSAFLSSFFTLVGTHGLHISFGLLWMGISMAVIAFRGLNSHMVRKLTLLSLFWHFLDIVWIFIFTIGAEGGERQCAASDNHRIRGAANGGPGGVLPAHRPRAGATV
jgi:cytochrome o ubiquinol oxidase subunit 3